MIRVKPFMRSPSLLPLAPAACFALGLLHGLGTQAADAPLPYVTEPAFGQLSFEQPLAIEAPPGETNRLFILEKPGRIVVISDLAHPTRSVFLDLTERVGSNDGEMGVLALAFHPDYAYNRQFYVWYTSSLQRIYGTVQEDLSGSRKLGQVEC